MVVRQLKASSLAEVVIALAIISISFALVARVFSQTARSTILFHEVKEQSEFQGEIMNTILKDTLFNQKVWDGKSTTVTSESASVENVTLIILKSGEKKLWTQEIVNHED